MVIAAPIDQVAAGTRSTAGPPLAQHCPSARSSQDARCVPPAFSERLEQAIASLTPAQTEGLMARAPEARGIKAAIAAVAGLPSPNVLSDILAGRVPGTKYRAALAEAVASELAWLEGTSDTPPDWAMSPIGAWRRHARRLEEAAQRARTRAQSMQSTLPVPQGDARDRIEAAMLGRELEHDPRDPVLIDLIKGRFTRPPIALVWRYGEHIGLATPLHTAHLERGRDAWSACEEEFAAQLAEASDRFKRTLPPPALFRLMRAALADMRHSMQYRGEDTRAVEDALELLWAQQWLRTGRSRLDVPKGLVEETGRGKWSRLRDIQAQYAADSDIDGRYRPRQA